MEEQAQSLIALCLARSCVLHSPLSLSVTVSVEDKHGLMVYLECNRVFKNVPLLIDCNT